MSKQTVWKYELPPGKRVTLQVPLGSRALSVHVQNEQPCIWYLVEDPQAPKSSFNLRIVSTGEQFNPESPELGVFLGTFMVRKNQAYHVFEDI